MVAARPHGPLIHGANMTRPGTRTRRAPGPPAVRHARRGAAAGGRTAPAAVFTGPGARGFRRPGAESTHQARPSMKRGRGDGVRDAATPGTDAG